MNKMREKIDPWKLPDRWDRKMSVIPWLFLKIKLHFLDFSGKNSRPRRYAIKNMWRIWKNCGGRDEKSGKYFGNY